LLSDVEESSLSYSESVKRLASAMLDNGLTDDVTHLLKRSGKQRLLLVLDQFEELFTQCHDEEMIHKFMDDLLELVGSNRRERLPITVLCSFRSDYMPRMAKYSRFASRVSASWFDIPPLTKGELREVIEEPAALVGVSFEKGLVERITDDVLGQPSSL